MMSIKTSLAFAAVLAPLPVFAVLIVCSVQYWNVPHGWIIFASCICAPIYITYFAVIALRMRKWSEDNDTDRIWWMDGHTLLQRLRHPAPGERRPHSTDVAPHSGGESSDRG